MNETPRKNESSNVTDREAEKLSAYLPELSKCISQHDIYRFRELASGLRKVLDNLEFTDLSKKLQNLDAKCVTAQDLVLNEIELQEFIKELTSINTIAGEAGKHGKP